MIASPGGEPKIRGLLRRMNLNGFTIKSDTELSEYQKKIETIDNVILCVAEAERMLADIGRSLAPQPRPLDRQKNKLKFSRFRWIDRMRRYSFK
jgi:hypothetical protein